jgi:hypothetical protein
LLIRTVKGQEHGFRRKCRFLNGRVLLVLQTPLQGLIYCRVMLNVVMVLAS